MRRRQWDTALTVAVIAGDSIAGEASQGTLRYLLLAPAGAASQTTQRFVNIVRLAQDGLVDSARAEMRRVLAEIQSGEFARAWMDENKNGRPNFTRMRAEGAAHPIEQVGQELRAKMPWITAGRADIRASSGGQGAGS